MFGIFKKKKENLTPVKYWDFSYANNFLKEYKDYIELFELRMFEDDYVCKTFMENGQITETIGAGYKMYSSDIDGVIHTYWDIPCIHVIYKGGKEEWIACYIEVLGNKKISTFSESHRKLTKERNL